MFVFVHFGQGLFCYSNFNFSYIDDKKETNLIAKGSHMNSYLFLKINKYYASNKTNREPTASVLLKNFFGKFIHRRFFEEYYDKFHNRYLTKHHKFLVFFPLYCQFVAST